MGEIVFAAGLSHDAAGGATLAVNKLVQSLQQKS
jgi:hypothetical protein